MDLLLRGYTPSPGYSPAPGCRSTPAPRTSAALQQSSPQPCSGAPWLSSSGCYSGSPCRAGGAAHGMRIGRMRFGRMRFGRMLVLCWSRAGRAGPVLGAGEVPGALSPLHASLPPHARRRSLCDRSRSREGAGMLPAGWDSVPSAGE